MEILKFKRDQIKFGYRGTNLPQDLIILSAKLHAKAGNKNLINEKLKNMIKKKKSHNKSNKNLWQHFQKPKR